ncbi:MAG: SpoIIE family protein phosphatase [Victivallales bacterium]|nr:SpoIIE family protein phosphatase [Victivallales bacterium]MCF7889509.1 SpoIIE family protein phosphatase [Victivallales bacterium]
MTKNKILTKIRVNTFFSICLFVIISALILFLFYVSIKNINEAETFTEKNAFNNISMLVDRVFMDDIKREVSIINKEFKEIADQGKHLSLLMSMGRFNYESKFNGNEFDYDSKKGLYYHFNKDKKDHIKFYGIGETELGFFSIYSNKSNSPPDKNIYAEFYNFYRFLPLLKEVIELNKSILGFNAYYFSGLLLFYIVEPEYNFKSINGSEDLLKEKTEIIKSLQNNKHDPVFGLFRGAGFENFTAILALFPLKDADKKITGALMLFISYDILVSNLSAVSSPDSGNSYNTLRIVLDDQGHIAYLPKDKYSLLSIPLDKAKLNYSPEVDNFIKTKLKDSDNPDVVRMQKQLFRNSEGKFEVILRNEIYIVIFKTLPINNWKVALLVKKNDLYQPLIKTESKFKTIYKHIYENYLIAFLIALIAGFIFSYFIFKKFFIKPIENVMSDASRLGKGDFDANVNESGLKEIYELSSTFNNLGEQLKNYTENLKNEIETRQKIETELKIAGDLQRSVLPGITSKFKSENFELYARLIPAKEMSGDFYDFFYINDEKTLVLVLADVSGKGLRAAFYMSMAKALIRETSLSIKENVTPGKVFYRVNNILSRNNESCMFLTAYLIFYDLQTGKFLFSNAGHHNFICTDKLKNIKLAGESNNPVLGIIENSEFITSEYKLEKGEVLALFTDGIIEAPDQYGIEYGMERIVDIYKNKYNGHIEEIGNYIIEDLLDYQSGKKFDDITLFMLKRKT